MTETAVQICGLSYAWPGREEATLKLNDLSVNIKERFFIQGASGSGKSTLLGLLSGILTPDQGSVSILGSPVSTWNNAARDSFRADHIGYIFQQFNLVPYLSALENILLPLRFSPKRREKVGDPLKEAHELMDHLGMDPERYGRHNTTELSVGQQQRVAAARALIGSPELILADEPTSALDAANREAFIELLFRASGKAGASLIFVSHDASLAPLFDRTLQLKGGTGC